MGQRGSLNENQKHTELNENENTTYQNLSDAAKVVLTGKLIMLQCLHLKRGKSSNQQSQVLLQTRKRTK